MTFQHVNKLVTTLNGGDVVIQPNSDIYVYKAGTSTLENIYTNRVGSVLKNNPFNNGSTAMASFYIKAGRYDIYGDFGEPALTLLYEDLLVVDEDVLSGPNGQLMFQNVLALEAGQPLNSDTIDATEIGVFVGQTVKTVWNNATSKKGGAEYVIWTLEDYRTFIGDGTWVPDGYGDHYVGGTTHVAVLNSDEITASSFGFTGSGDETEPFKAFFAYYSILKKNLDISFSVSGVAATADGTKMYASNNAVITVTGDVTTDPDASAANQGQAIELGNDCVLTGIEIEGAGTGQRGAGFLNQQKSNATLQLCRADNNTWQAVHDFGGVNSKYLNCTFSRSLHGVQMWLTNRAEVSGCHVYQVYGGIWTAVARDVSCYGNDVHDCEDVGIDWEGGQRCYAWGNKLRSCNRGALTVFGTGPELVGEGIVMGDLGFISNEVVHQSTFLNRLGVETDNDLNDTAAMMLYFIDDTTSGPVYWKGNTIHVEDSTATNPGSLRAMTCRADISDHNDWVIFEGNTIYTKFRSAFRFQELRRLMVSKNNIHFIGVTQTSFDEIKNQHYGIFSENKVYFDENCTPWSPTWSITNDKAMDGNMLLEECEFYNGAATAIDINQSNVKRVTLKECKLAPSKGSSTGGLTITSGLVQPINQQLVFSLGDGGSVDFSTVTGVYKTRGMAEGIAASSAGGTNGPLYRFMIQTNDIAGNCEIASLDGSGLGAGQFPDAARGITFSGTTITSVDDGTPPSNSALIEMTLNERTSV